MIMRAPDGLALFQAAQRYVLIDQQRLDPALIARQQSVLSLLFRLELSETPDVVREVLPLLLGWLSAAPQAPLRRSVTLWIERLMAREMQGVSITELIEQNGGLMDARKFATWADYLENQGLQKGLVQGKELGLAEGKAEGKAEGQRIALRAIMQKRFGPLPYSAMLRIEQVADADIAHWIERAVDADSIDVLFAGQTAPGEALPAFRGPI